MKHLKLFEGFQSEEEVAEICRKYNIQNWIINSEGLVDVYGGVRLLGRGLKEIPLKFGNVAGNFDCDKNQLTSLEGCPHTVGGIFDCSRNKLVNLDGCPKEVGGDFRCEDNQLTSFEGTKSIGGYFNCYKNPLYSIWNLINTEDNSWDSQVMELFNDYDCIRGNDIILDRFNDFLEEIGKSPVDKVERYNNI
jgi:hypothetical protein